MIEKPSYKFFHIPINLCLNTLNKIYGTKNLTIMSLRNIFVRNNFRQTN